MDNYKVSVVLVTYNHYKFISQAIESILRQSTDFDYEILIHDDASVDGTSDIVRLFSARYPGRIKYVIQSENKYSQGVRIFNLACTYASSPLIAICEGDDYWVDDCKLQKQYDYMKKNITCGAVFSDANIYFESTKELVLASDARRKYIPPTGDVRTKLILGNPYKTCTVMFRRNIFLSYVKHAVKIKSKMDDYVAWLTISMTHDVGYIPEALATYRVLPDSASHFSDWKNKVRFDRSAYKVSVYFNDLMGFPVSKDLIKSNYSYSLFLYFLRNKMPIKSLKYFRCSPYLFGLCAASIKRFWFSKTKNRFK